MIIFFDTETTGKWDFQGAWNAKHQPNLIQLGYQIYDSGRNLIKEVDCVVDSRTLSAWNGIEPGAAAVHGISEERMDAEGKPVDAVAAEFVRDLEACKVTVAHNNSFDMQIMNCFLYRAGYAPTIFESRTNICTMKPLTNLLKIPSPNGRGYKWPKLDEAYRALINRQGFVGAHDALTDVRACQEIFWFMLDKGVVPEFNRAKEFFNAAS